MSRENMHDVLIGVVIVGLAYAVYMHYRQATKITPPTAIADAALPVTDPDVAMLLTGNINDLVNQLNLGG